MQTIDCVVLKVLLNTLFQNSSPGAPHCIQISELVCGPTCHRRQLINALITRGLMVTIFWDMMCIARSDTISYSVAKKHLKASLHV